MVEVEDLVMCDLGKAVWRDMHCFRRSSLGTRCESSIQSTIKQYGLDIQFAH